LLNGAGAAAAARTASRYSARHRSRPQAARPHPQAHRPDRFYAKARAQDSIPASETALREQIASLRRQLDHMRGERDEYKHAAQALARALSVLTTENDSLRSQVGRPRS
jgi:chromosome segregation ATPase